MKEKINILTIDLEDWFHILANESSKTVSQWTNFPSRVIIGAQLLLDALAKHQQKATFFCLGWTAEQHPQLIKEIVSQGHEIATHSYMHQLVYEQTPKEWEDDIDRSIKTLEDISGQKITTYRAPGFSLVNGCEWVFEALAQRGIDTDCSIFPTARAHGGFKNFGAAKPCWVNYKGNLLKEFPMNYATVLGQHLVFSGGGYFRVLPYPLIARLIRDTDYVMTYFHPRDFDAEQPMLPGLSIIRKFKSYYGIGGALAKLDKMLTDFKFQSLGDAKTQIDWAVAPIVQL
jgi:polysaccharide deacetylase family protein (PEP-CTERM system associated)